MICNKISNTIGEVIVRNIGGSLLDANNILWKIVDGKWVGKRSVWTYDFRACWIEDTSVENISSYWCGGKDADYAEVFYRD